MNKTFIRRIGRRVLAPALCLSLLCAWPQSAAAAVYYEKTEREVLGKNIVYEASKSVTDKGMLDVFVLRVPLKDPYITVKPVQSSKEAQLKEYTTNLLLPSGAIAGVNGDFFNMSGSYSAVGGPVVADGSVRALDRMNNLEKKEYAALFLSKDGSPFFDYVNAEIRFTHNNEESIKIFAINKITDMTYSVYIDSKFMKDTSAVDRQFPGIAKIVVENDVITYISKKGELVTVPENGYVILISEASADEFTTYMKVGQKASMSIRSSVDFAAIQNAIGGGGRLLIAGQLANDGGFVPTGSQPRTAVGFNADKTELILMVVDGRTHSIGATHQQLGELMLKYGATEAMHLDGGGSSTMAIKKIGEGSMDLVNTPSGGAQRKVSNALGVFSEAPVGAAQSLQVRPRSNRVFRGTGLPVGIFGVDEYLNAISYEQPPMVLSFSDPGAIYRDGVFYPSVTGPITISASVAGMEAQAVVESKELAQIVPSPSSIQAGVGGRVDLSFSGKSNDAYNGYIYDGLKLEVTPASVGHMEGNTFVADAIGAGYIKCSAGDVACYIDVNVGYQTVPVPAFNEERAIEFVGAPEGLTGNVAYDKEKAGDGSNALKMSYALKESEEVQAAYLKFTEPLELPNGTRSFKLSVFGDNSYYWLRAKLIDAAGTEHLVDLAKSVDWTGWKEVSATVPSGAKQPLRLERVYAASLSNIDTNAYTLYFNKLVCETLINNGKLDHPADTRYEDGQKADLSEPPAIGFDITAAGNIVVSGDKKPANYEEARGKIIAAAKKHTTRLLFAAGSDITSDIGVDYLNWDRTYAAHEVNNALLLRLHAEKGGFAATDPAQWGYFTKSISGSECNVIVVQTDISPVNFTYPKEFELFQDLMESLVSEGKMIYVISTEGAASSVTTRNGVRYVNLGGLWKADGTVNAGASVLRLRVTPDNVTYELQNVMQ